MQLEYTTLNAQKKVQSYTSMKVKDVSGTTDNKMVKVVIQTLNAQKNPTSESMAFDVNIKGGKIILDPKLMFAPYLQANMKITGKPNSIPATLSTGQTWPDVELYEHEFCQQCDANEGEVNPKESPGKRNNQSISRNLYLL